MLLTKALNTVGMGASSLGMMSSCCMISGSFGPWQAPRIFHVSLFLGSVGLVLTTAFSLHQVFHDSRHHSLEETETLHMIEPVTDDDEYLQINP